MVGLLIAGAVLMAMFGIGLVLAAVAVMVRTVFWLLLLPFKLLFGALTLAILVPIILIGAAVLVVGVFFAVLTPLLPFVLLAVIVWALVRIFERPARVRA